MKKKKMGYAIFASVLTTGLSFGVVGANELAPLVSKMATNINKEAPVTMELPDGTTVTMLFASSSGVRLTYHYQLHAIDIDEIDRNAFNVVMEPIVKSQICSDPVSDLLQHGIELAYSYLDIKRTYISTYALSYGDC